MGKKVKIDIDEPKPKGQLEKLGFGDAEAKALAAQIMTDFNQSEQSKWLWIPERNEDVKNYFGVTKSAEWPFKGASRIKSQFFRIVVDTLAGNLIKSLFLPERPIKPVPAPIGAKTDDNALKNIKYVEDLHNALQEHEYNLKEVLDKAIPTALIESFCVLHPTYEYLVNELYVDVTRLVPKEVDVTTLKYDIDTDEVMDQSGATVVSLDPLNGYDEEEISKLQEVTFQVEKEECVKDGISIKIINGYRFYMPLGSPGETPYEKIQRAPYLVHQLFYTLREVDQFADQGYFEQVNIVMNNVVREANKYRQKNGKKPILAATVYDRQRELITYTKLVQAGFLLDTARSEYEYVEVLKWCGKWKIDGKWTNCIAWIDRNTMTLLRVEKNIFGIKPYFPLVPFPVDETPYGESICKIIRPIVQEIDLLMRTITNIALMKAAPPKFYDPASGFNPQSVGQYGPNSWIPAREPSRNVLVPPAPEDPQVAFEMVKFLINILERITGISETIQGQISQRSNTTASEVQEAMVRSGVRFDSIYDRLKSQLKPMFKYIHRLTLRNMPLEKEVQLMGKENEGRLSKIHKSQVMGDYEFELTGSSVVTEQKELQNALALYNTVGQHPYLTYKPESIYYVLYNIVKRLNPLAMDKILPTPQEVKMLERDAAQSNTQQEHAAAKHAAGQTDGSAEAAKQQLQLEQAKFQMEAQQKQQLHEQNMKHQDDKHRLDMIQMQEKIRAQQQQAEIQLAQMKARAHAAAQSTGKETSKE